MGDPPSYTGVIKECDPISPMKVSLLLLRGGCCRWVPFLGGKIEPHSSVSLLLSHQVFSNIFLLLFLQWSFSLPFFQLDMSFGTDFQRRGRFGRQNRSVFSRRSNGIFFEVGNRTLLDPAVCLRRVLIPGWKKILVHGEGYRPGLDQTFPVFPENVFWWAPFSAGARKAFVGGWARQK